ncbi:hypothetical protein ACWOAH_09110 [Vagococcus vulneris]|nr:hypothetical protein [Vagococcus vulneris]
MKVVRINEGYVQGYMLELLENNESKAVIIVFGDSEELTMTVGSTC